MFRKLQRTVVPTVPKAEHDNLKEQVTIVKGNNEKLQQQVKTLTVEVAALEEANASQLAECMRLATENDTLRAIVQEALNLFLKEVDTKRTGGEPLRKKIHSLVQQAQVLGLDIFEVVRELKEGKETTDGNH